MSAMTPTSRTGATTLKMTAPVSPLAMSAARVMPSNQMSTVRGLPAASSRALSQAMRVLPAWIINLAMVRFWNQSSNRAINTSRKTCNIQASCSR